MRIPLLVWLLQGIPECIALATFLMSGEKKRLQWKVIFTIGLIQAVMCYFVRILPFTPGVHTLVLITTLAFLGIVIGKIEMKKAVTLSVVIMAFLIIFEAVFFYLMIYLKVVSYEALSSNQYVRILIGIPQTTAIFLISYFIRKKLGGCHELFKS